MAGKISKWQDRLLDLGKRNKLLFFKPAANASLEVLSPGADVFFDKLTSKSSFEIFDLDGKCEANKGGKIIDRNAAIEFFGKRIKAKEVLLHSPGKPVAEILKTLHKRNREFFTERGINILYAAFGFMEWKDKQGDANYSPLLLVPVALSKTGANKPYILELFEDETIVNPALKYKLSSEFKIDLPEMSDSDSVTTYINKSAALLGNLAKISGRAEISLFYYNKVNMYLDLKNNAKVIEKNINVRALLGEGMLPQPVSGFSKRQHNVVDADASQSEAIAFAKTGESFVLQGPPGTGKSQTITNLIAEYLAAGKKVLFVSEKLAALQVVYNNLKKVGLEDYALELHSHKANKKDAIEELSRTLCLPAKNLSKRALEEEDTLASVSSKLAKYADFLHTETKLGTPFFMIDSLSDFDDKDFSYIFRDISIFDRAKLKRAEELLDNYSGYSGTIGADYRKYPWYGYKGGTDYQSRLRLKEQVKSAADGANALMKASGYLSAMGFKADTVARVRAYAAFFRYLEGLRVRYSGFYDKIKNESLHKKFSALSKLNDRMSVLEKELSVYKPEIFGLDADAMLRRFAKYKTVFHKLSGQYRRDKNAVISLCRDKRKLSQREIVRILFELKKYQDASSEFDKMSIGLNDLIGDFYKGRQTDFSYIIKVITDAADFASMLSLEPILKGRLDERIPELIKYSLMVEACGAETEQLTQFISDFEDDLGGMPLDKLCSKVCGCYERHEELAEWEAVRFILDRIASEGLSEFLIKAIDGGRDPYVFSRLFKAKLYSQSLYALFAADPLFSSMPRIEHDRLTEEFKSRDRVSMEISKARIDAKMSAMRPAQEMIANGGKASLLMRESEKKRRQMPIRMLFERMPEIIYTLKPCMLMSPLSVSTYLPGEEIFDVAIFDEASQIFPEDALGAIYRAKQIIVVGDSKQMPPSNFFTAAVSDAEYDDDSGSGEGDAGDFESVLDVASAAFTQKRLMWHYRSRSESLISFSNRNYYKDSLMTFPAARRDGKDFGVEFYYIEGGIFDRSTRQNLVEAQKVADMVFDCFRNNPERSVGVVAFSISQQDAIERCIAELRNKHHGFDAYFDTSGREPFFVKNLETVQGDERDTIIFSIAYGFDKNGKFLHNFGPLSKTGGERRLNVAVTRAKYDLKVVSSVMPADIDLGRATGVGAAQLKAYLEYAGSGGTYFVKRDDTASGLKKSVVQAVQGLGYKADTDVGNSRYPVDVAVLHPVTNEYFMAIECDGEGYYGLKSVRDRERLRAEVLNKYDWSFYRIWAADWFRSNKTEIERLRDALLDALNTKYEALPPVQTDKDDFLSGGHEGAFRKYDHFNIDRLIRDFAKDGDKEIISRICESESPISLDYLIKRTLAHFGYKKLNNTHAAFVENTVRSQGFRITDGFIYFPLKKGAPLRIHTDGQPIRELVHISLQELSEGLNEIIRANHGISKDALFLHTLRLLGYQKNGANLSARLKAALDLLFADGRVISDNGVLSPS